MTSLSDIDITFRTHLQATGVCEVKDLARAVALADRDQVRLDRVLLKLGLVEEAALADALANVFGLERVQLNVAEPDVPLIRQLTPGYLLAQMAVPLMGEDNTVPVAMADPLDSNKLAEIGFHLDRPVVPYAATTAELRILLARTTEPQDSADTGAAQINRDAEDLRRAGVDGPVIRFVQDLLSDAVQAGASDLHVEAADDLLRLRFRLNGVLVPQAVPPQMSSQAVLARLKVMAGLNVAERRLPQDGRLQAIIAGRRVDFRFSSLPTYSGESIVARVLDPKALRLGWEKLGFAPDVIDWLKVILAHPSGLFLVTGPTGSGKTTTLYTALSHLNTPGRKIITIEDPVEYSLPKIQQIQVQEEIGLSFARILRGVLRHDPNVIMVGEIRDPETAEIAVRAAQVGRLVLSTLHTNSAAGAVNRLLDLGVPRFLLNDVLRGVLGQELRLVSCPACDGMGCEKCSETGVIRRELRVERWEGTGR